MAVPLKIYFQDLSPFIRGEGSPMDGPYISNDIYETLSMLFDLHFEADHLATGLDSMNVELNTGPMGWDRAGGLK